MKVSIVIPNYNGEKFLKECLESIAAQTFKDYEIIFVDNASNDNSVNIIKKKYNHIRLIELNENYGFSRAVNEGIKASYGEYVVLLNNDTKANNNWLFNLVKAMDNDKNLFSVSSKMIRYSDESLIDDAGDYLNILGWAYKNGDGKDISRYTSDKYIFSSCAGAAIYNKKYFDEVGYFDESFFAYLEDIDICYRAKICGYKNRYSSNAEILHIGSGTSGSKYNEFKVSLAARNSVYLIYKNMPLLQLVINSPFLLIGFLIKQVFFIKKGFGALYFKGLITGIKNLKSIDKNKFKSNNIINYIKIEVELVINTLRYIFVKVF